MVHASALGYGLAHQNGGVQSIGQKSNIANALASSQANVRGG